MYNKVSDWLDDILGCDIPNEVAGFCFNLYEDGDNFWSMELVGAERFDKEDEDWLCDEVTDFGTRDEPLRWNKDAGWNLYCETILIFPQTYSNHRTSLVYLGF